MFTFPPIERLGDADASASPASRSPAQSRSPKKKSPKKKRTLKMSSRVRVNDPDPDMDGQVCAERFLGCIALASMRANARATDEYAYSMRVRLGDLC